MIFKRELAAKVLSGQKTMTRRKLPCRYQVDHWYTVQPGRGKKHVCHVFVTGVRAEHLGDITYADAQREGFDNAPSFVGYWRRIHGGFNADELVGVLEWAEPIVKDCCAKLEAL